MSVAGWGHGERDREEGNRGRQVGIGRMGRQEGWVIMLLLLVIGVVGIAESDYPDEDDLTLLLDHLYRNSEGDMDPHDMLSHPGKKYPAPHSSKAKGMLGSGAGDGEHQDQDKRKGESLGCEGEEGASQELSGCLTRLNSLQDMLEGEQTVSLQLRKMLAKEGIMDLQAFYKRATQHFWNTLRLEEGQEILREGNTALVRQVTVRVTQDDLEGLRNYLKTETQPHKVDEFLERGFTLEEPSSDSSPSWLHSIHTLGTSILQAVKSLEVWLWVLCLGFVALGLWAVMLFVKDIQRELRWGRILSMMATVVFFICCLWHWRHMYKMAESRRHAHLTKRGYSDIPEECRPGAPSSASIFDWMKVNVFGSPDVCERYFEELMIDAIEEITPGMVIAETLSKMFFQPLQHLGSESGKLTSNFYKNVPAVYHLHATALFLGLLLMVLFCGCAYGVDFPLGLGGFRPMARQPPSSAAPIDRGGGGLGREVIEQLHRDRERFLEESRRMLSDISRATLNSQGQQQQQPLVVASSVILEAHLEQLISYHLDRAMEQGRQGVRTITSTPLRTEGRFTPELQAAGSEGKEEQHSQGTSTSSEGSEDVLRVPDGSSNSNAALLVSTDAVHRRLTGTPPVKYLPPRTSCSSSASSSPAPSEMNSPSSHRQKASKLMRMFHSADSPPSPPPSPSASTQSLGQEGLDEPDLGSPPDSKSFLAEIKDVLNISANSGPPSPPISNGDHSNGQM